MRIKMSRFDKDGKIIISIYQIPKSDEQMVLDFLEEYFVRQKESEV